jgi:hypothetical protein
MVAFARENGKCHFARARGDLRMQLDVSDLMLAREA